MNKPIEKPILFSGPMVRAILDGTKTMTRRVVKPKHQPFVDNLLKKFLGGEWGNRPLPYKTGDRLWVRETWSYDEPQVIYRADYNGDVPPEGKWHPSIFMPRWASRITLEVTGVKVERLQEISNEDIRKEGVAVLGCVTHRLNFEQLWDSLNGKTYPWASNPFVWVIEFRRIDAL